MIERDTRARTGHEAGQDTPRSAGQSGTCLWHLSRCVPLPSSAAGTPRDKCPALSRSVPLPQRSGTNHSRSAGEAHEDDQQVIRLLVAPEKGRSRC